MARFSQRLPKFRMGIHIRHELIGSLQLHYKEYICLKSVRRCPHKLFHMLDRAFAWRIRETHNIVFLKRHAFYFYQNLFSVSLHIKVNP